MGVPPNEAWHEYWWSVEIDSPSGRSNSASIGDSSDASANYSGSIETSLPINGEDGEFHIGGVWTAWCSYVGGYFLNASQDMFASIKQHSGQFNGQGYDQPGVYHSCGYDPNCVNTTTPACGSWTHYQGSGTTCATYRIGSFLKLRVAGQSGFCVSAFTNAATAPGYCDQ